MCWQSAARRAPFARCREAAVSGVHVAVARGLLQLRLVRRDGRLLGHLASGRAPRHGQRLPGPTTSTPGTRRASLRSSMSPISSRRASTRTFRALSTTPSSASLPMRRPLSRNRPERIAQLKLLDPEDRSSGHWGLYTLRVILLSGGGDGFDFVRAGVLPVCALGCAARHGARGRRL